jgi:hypothetical protein
MLAFHYISLNILRIFLYNNVSRYKNYIVDKNNSRVIIIPHYKRKDSGQEGENIYRGNISENIYCFELKINLH